ncbi:kelch repeat and BTB domain-containing protein 11 [Boleophthalmus pectinirostris]|uniref:kelch repeat and BTB domain-containing protein 11 n=1 Tax=Boleophthalmus pectinirostris TaxID=150288 RepID=UPI000A1C518A|nr:kelch repeat and BTB domain-containing protein 11 [Boleophthalmus pectinirostris]
MEVHYRIKLSDWKASTETGNALYGHQDSEEWKTNEELRIYCYGNVDEAITIQTSTHAFTVDLQRLAACSEYFRALSQSRMRETTENFIYLEHVPSSVFHNLLEFSFYGRFSVPPEDLASHIQVCSYLVAESFLAKCVSEFASELSPHNCASYVTLERETCCPELRQAIFKYLKNNMLELPHVIRSLYEEEKEELVHLRTDGALHLCCLRKENLTSWTDPQTEQARYVFVLEGPEETGEWRPLTELPFRADKWCFTTVVLHNYLYIIGGYRQRTKRGWDFKMSSFRYNPFTNTWVTTAPLIKCRRHFSAVACSGSIYAVGGWYLDSLVTPDSSTALYTAVECYDPWEDTWRLVSSLPLTDFQFTVSLSHDVPLAASRGHSFYVLGNIQRTGEKLLLQYDTRQDSWCEILPTLTRGDADLPTLYFLGAAEKLFVIGGNISHNVVTSFCLQSQKWEQVQMVDKVAFAGQGTVSGGCIFLPSIEHNTVMKMDVQTLSLYTLPQLPIPALYESAFHMVL